MLEKTALVSHYGLTISSLNVQSATDLIDTVLISGPADVELVVSKDTKGNISIPDISDTFSGILMVEDDSPIELRNISDKEAKTLIMEYLTNHPGAFTSELICELGIEPNIVLRVLRTLKDEDRVESRDIIVESES